MRITSFAPSMTRPTYAVSSAPQGTFGATTPMTRLVAPAAAETQRSGGVSVPQVLRAGKKAFTGLTLSSLLAVAGCGDQEAAKFANSLGIKSANSAEAVLVGNFPTSNVLGFTGATDSIATVLGPKAGDTVTGGGSTLVDSVVKEVLNPTLPACQFGDKIPPNVDTNDATSVDWSRIGVTERGKCLVRWGEKDPKNLQLPLLRQTQQQQEATLVAIESPNGGPCAMPTITKWRAKFNSNPIGLTTNPARKEVSGSAEEASGVLDEVLAIAGSVSQELKEEGCSIAESEINRMTGNDFTMAGATRVQTGVSQAVGGNLSTNGVVTVWPSYSPNPERVREAFQF